MINLILTSKNQFNYSVKQIEIDYDNKTFKVMHGGQCLISRKNSTTKAINQKIAEMQAIGIKEI